MDLPEVFSQSTRMSERVKDYFKGSGAIGGGAALGVKWPAPTCPFGKNSGYHPSRAAAIEVARPDPLAVEWSYNP